MNGWNLNRGSGIVGIWPTDSTGSPVPSVFLQHVSGNAMDLALLRNMLASYGVASVCRYPNNGEFGNVVLGYAGGGADIFVPETLYEDACNLVSGNAQIIDTEGDNL